MSERNGLDGSGGGEESRIVLCEKCQQKEAMCHLTIQRRRVQTVEGIEVGGSEPSFQEHHFCNDCCDEYDKENDMNSSRDLIQLSDRYRSKMYDLLEMEHPEVFKAGDDKLEEAADTMEKFLRAQLKSEGIEVNADGFGILFGPFIGSAEFYERCDRIKRGE